MRTWIYELLTQAIIVLGWLRAKVARSIGNVAVSARVFDSYGVESAYCCDCGLGHLREPVHPVHEPCHHVQPPILKAIAHLRPIRPTSYRYRLRWFAERPSLAIEPPAPPKAKESSDA